MAGGAEGAEFAGVKRSCSRETGEVFVPVEDMEGEPCGVSAVAMDMVAALMLWVEIFIGLRGVL